MCRARLPRRQAKVSDHSPAAALAGCHQHVVSEQVPVDDPGRRHLRAKTVKGQLRTCSDAPTGRSPADTTLHSGNTCSKVHFGQGLRDAVPSRVAS